MLKSYPEIDAIIFLVADFIALGVQGAGGGIASSAATLEGANNGGRIMLGGIILQLGRFH